MTGVQYINVGVSARAAVSVHGVPGGVHLQAVPGDPYAHAHRRAAVRVRYLLQALHAEVHAQHPQANTHRYAALALLSRRFYELACAVSWQWTETPPEPRNATTSIFMINNPFLRPIFAI